MLGILTTSYIFGVLTVLVGNGKSDSETQSYGIENLTGIGDRSARPLHSNVILTF